MGNSYWLQQIYRIRHRLQGSYMTPFKIYFLALALSLSHLYTNPCTYAPITLTTFILSK